MDCVLQRHLSRIFRRESRGRPNDSTKKRIKYERLQIDGNILNYVPDERERVGVYIAAEPVRPEANYFEIEINEGGVECSMSLGLVSSRHPMDQHPGCVADSVGLHADGRLYNGSLKVTVFGPRCEVGDKIGCGVRFEQLPSRDAQRNIVPVFFTKNGKELGTVMVSWPPGGLYPAVGLHSLGEEVKLVLDIKWLPEDDMLMCIDSNEDDWLRLHDIHLNGCVLEYAGRGKSILDVGLAQARHPLDTTSHYFEIEILDPGENCYIAIGLARRNYPKHSHPGWNKGSIAYHADDGKIFVGSGAGDPFGPRCHKGDVMGCGIIFPRDYISNFDGDESPELTPSDQEYFDDSQSDSEDDEWWKEKNYVENGMSVQVFFTRNGSTIGQKEVCIPKGGFYPTVGMLSIDEKVKVDLHPLTG